MTAERFGRYIIKRELGRGSMSRVFLAHDPHMERDVAIKVLVDAYLEDAISRRRFQREVTTVARIDHDGIVPVYDAGEHNGHPYLVMRYLPGGSLRDRMSARKPLPPEDVRQIILRLAEALDAAHAHNVVHRDIKPANVLMDESGLCYLTDFSLARIIENTMTTTAVTTGTPHYMAPEQWQGQPIDPRTDVYQLGVMLFEMLTGQLPFSSDQLHAFITQHLHDPVPSARQLNPSLPLACDGVLERAMAKAPAARFETAGEIAIALEQALASGTIGRYQIKRILTTGGMGTVYLAYDPQIERDVAVKVIKNRRLDGDATALEDFRREAKIVASLEHDAIVPVYDFGEHQGKPYLVMRHMLGGSLDDRLQDHTTLSLEEICLALKRLAGALDYAHARGVLHCDIKPANVLLGKSGSAYLSDFGLARDIGRSDSSGARGSPPYMAPEQWQGQDHATAQTDIYQLGITLFEMLTGQRPYGGTRSAAFMYKHLLGPIPSARELNPALPPDCDLILAKALAKEPTDRFTTAGQMAKAFAAAALPAEQMETALDVEALSDTPPKARGLTQTGFWGWPPGWVWLLILLLPLVGYLIFRLAMANNGNGGGLASQVTDVPAAITLTVTEAAEEAMQTPETSNALFPAIADSVTITPTKALSATATWTPTPTNTLTPAPTDSTTATGTPPPTPPLPEVRVIPSSLSFRDGPGMIYGVVGYLYAGDIVTVVARTSGQGWYLVKTESGDLGWISAVYTTAVNQPAMTSVPTALTVPAPPPTATPTATRTPTPTPTVSRGDDGGGGGGPKPRPSPTID